MIDVSSLNAGVRDIPQILFLLLGVVGAVGVGFALGVAVQQRRATAADAPAQLAPSGDEDSQDRTERRRQALLSAAQVEILRLISRGQVALPAILEAIVERSEALCVSARASIVYVRDGCIWHGVAPGLPSSFIEAIEGLPIGPRRGSCGTAAYLGHRVIVEDVLTDPLWAEFRELALATGVRACSSQPVFDRYGQVVATFALYRDAPHAPDAFELELIDSMAELLSIAIQSRRASDQFFLTFHSAPNGLLLLRPNGEISLANEYAQGLLGYPASSLAGMPLSAVTSEPWEALLAGGEAGEGATVGGSRPLGERREIAIIRADGSQLPVEIELTVLDSGLERWILASLVSIAQHKQAMRALQESEERFRLIADNTSDGLLVFRFSEQGPVLDYASPSFLQMMGASLEPDGGLGGNAEVGPLHPDEHERLWREMEAAVARGRCGHALPVSGAPARR